MHIPPAMALVIILAHFLPLARAINVNFIPCDTDVNVTTVDCSGRVLNRVPIFKSSTVLSFDLSQTELQYVSRHAFSGVPNLRTLKIVDNCQPGQLRSPEDISCRVEIEDNAFEYLQNLTSLYLSGNSLTSIPQLPKSLIFLDLQKNCLITVTKTLNTPNLEILLLTKNCFYANPCNQSFYISEEVFQKLTTLKNLTMGYNNLTTVPKGLPHSLVHLDLKENTITEILEETFANMTALKHLNLEWNCQRCDHAARPCFPCPNNHPLKLHPKSFYSENSSITFLSLRGNSLRDFPKGMFIPLKNLNYLDISDNLLASAIQNGTFFGELENLQWISLIYNYEPYNTFPVFDLSQNISKMSNLQYLLLSGNFFNSFSNKGIEVLSSLGKLKNLELRMNFINSIDLTFLKRLPFLTSINLSQNMLNFLQCCSSSSSATLTKVICQNQNGFTESFHGPPFHLIDREITYTSDIWESDQSSVLGMFNNVPDDNVLHVRSLWDFREKICKHKLTFDLSQNDIMSLNKKVFSGMENASCLDLSVNYINQALRGPIFDGMKHLVFLNLSYNRLDLYYNDSFSEINSTLKVLDVSNNDFHFQMRGMGHRFEFLQNLNNLQALGMANNGIGMRINQRLICSSLEYLYFSGNHLDVMWESDNNQYISFFQNLAKLIYLDISNNGLKSVSPEVLHNFPNNLRTLSLSNNILTFFPWKNLSSLSSLRHLNLSHNLLSSLINDVVGFGANFSLLDLSHNVLSSIPEKFFSEAKSLKYLYLNHNYIKQLDRQHLLVLFKEDSALQHLSLHENPFSCDCNTTWFAEFLINTSIHIPHLTTRVKCGSPESQQGKSILTIDKRSCQDIYGNLALFITSFLTVMLTVLPLLKHLYGWDIWYCLQVLWAGHKGYSRLAGSNSHYCYDAFVVFDTSNQAVRDWVYSELIVNLENSRYRRFSLCLEERDWIPGLSCIENLHSAVQNSVKTVFVLSRGVNGSETVSGVIRQAFFMVQQRLLDEKVDAVVLVLLDEMFPKLKYLQLRKRLCKKSVLAWPRNPRAQPLFWNRMRIALSSDNLKFYDDNMSQSFM
ncbi:toll-like receptor 9 [Pholidichthys leucotaenia]